MFHYFFVFFSDFAKIVPYLESVNLDMRIAAGEILAFIYELGGEYYERFNPPQHAQIIEKLQILAYESVKSRAKRDRRIQRASFRDIFAAIQVFQIKIQGRKF